VPQSSVDDCLWSVGASEIPNSKLQITNKFQIPLSNGQNILSAFTFSSQFDFLISQEIGDLFSVMPAQAGIHVDRCMVFWIPAFAGMTIFFLENSPTHQFAKCSFCEIIYGF